MTKVKIYLKSGQVVEMFGEDLKVKTFHTPRGNITGLDWTGLGHGEHPVFINLNEVAAVTQVLKDPEDD